MFLLRRKLFLVVFFVFVFIFFSKFFLTSAFAAPTIGSVSVVTSTSVEKYSKFEVRFNAMQSIGIGQTNPYFPFDPNTFSGVLPFSRWATITENGWNWQNAGHMGINVDMMVLPPGQSSWSNAIDVPCFYYQPVEEVGLNSSNLFLEPVGSPEWRCRYAPQLIGNYQYQVTATDAGGTATPSAIQSFSAVTPAQNSPTRHGFVETNLTDPNLASYDSRFFTFSDGMPFYWSLTTKGFDAVTSQDPKLTNLRSDIQTLSTNGVKFIRWFPTDEGGGLFLFGGSVHNVWQNIGGYTIPPYTDDANGNLFGYKPGDYSAQYLPVKANVAYLMTIRAKVTGSETLKFGLTDAGATNFLASRTISANGGWQTYTLTYQNGNYSGIVGARLFGSVNPPDKGILVGVVSLQRDESGTTNCLTNSTCQWGSNLLSHGDPDTYRYVDQVHAAYLDEILKQSEQNGIYQILTMFHKNDDILNYFYGTGYYDGTQFMPWNFYGSADFPVRWIEFAYARYFVARYSYSTSLHSLEQANENDQGQFEPGGELAKYILSISPRHILMSNSYDTYLKPANWTDAQYGQYFDYANKHWYANHTSKTCSWSTNDESDPCGGSSNLWQDTVYNVRYIYLLFRAFASGSYHYAKPIIRGETGIATSGTQPPDPNVQADTTGTYYRKKVWSHVGILGYSADGEWYPYSTMLPFYKAYDAFMSSETTLNNGVHVEIGTDNMQINTTSCSTGVNCIAGTNSILRAFGSKDPATKRVLVWVDNKNNTWSGNPNNTTIASGTFQVFNMPLGVYTKETWDTRAGTYVTEANSVTVSTDGVLTFSASTATDVAYKFYVSGGVQPTVTPTPSCMLGDIDCSGHVNAIDLSRLILKFGQSGSMPEDIDGSGQVNAIDLAILLGNFGK
jgi:hypothetical protein